MATAPLFTRIVPAASRETTMVLSRSSPATVSTPVAAEKVAVTDSKMRSSSGCSRVVVGSADRPEPAGPHCGGMRPGSCPVALRPPVLAEVRRPHLEQRLRAPSEPELLRPLHAAVHLLDRALHRGA